MTGFILSRLPHVDDVRARFYKLAHFCDGHLFKDAVQYVETDEGCVIDDVFCGAEHRRIAQLELFQIFERSVQHNAGRDNVDPLIDSSLADRLRADDRSGGFFKNQFEKKRVRIRHETDFIAGDDVHVIVIDSRFFAGPLV